MQNTNKVMSFVSHELPGNDLELELLQTKTRLQLFKNISSQINAEMPVQQIIEQTLSEAHKSFPQFRISYCTIDSSSKMTVVHSLRPENMASIIGLQADLTDANELLEALKKCEALAVNDLRTDLRVKALSEVFTAAGARAVLIVPVRHPREALGYVAYSAPELREWTAHEIASLTDMAEYLAIALRQSHSQQEQARMGDHLRESQKMEAVGRLVGGIAHDFNNLLTAMMIYCGLLSTALGKAHRLHGHVDEIRQAGERGAHLVAQLLALTKQQVLEPKILTIDSVITGMSDMLQRMIGEDVVLLTSSADDLRSIKVDPAQLEQVILNMAINARDAMPLGGQLVIECANVFIDTRQAEEQGLVAGDYVQLRVSDTGHGMDADTRAHVFEPFFTTKELGKGTGLGLATAYGIVRQHGGNITVVSEVGKGTSFRILLPAIVSDEGAVSSRAEAVSENAVRKQETLLLVEDEDLVRRSLLETLRMSGYEVLEAAGGAQALEISDTYKGDIPLMITDLVMPGMNGRQVADRMAERRPKTAVLYMSGYTDDPRTRKMLGEGVEFFKKPFSPNALLDKIKDVLERAKARSAIVPMVPSGDSAL
ncbi:MAG: sensor hybrid histidine kinase [Acidobacteriales bacterium]|nr:sensor hybrid histidine kinase [Terriglobales bacterium]